MAVTVQMQFESAVTEMYQKAFVGSSLENGTTVIQFDLRQLDFQRELGTTSPIWWRQDVYHVEGVVIRSGIGSNQTTPQSVR
jgi:hypothetical protein